MTSDEKILNGLQAQCVRREYCTSDIYSKALKRCGGDAGHAREIVESLRSDGFVDDARYAAAFAREKSSLTGWGPVKIRLALAAKGLSREDIDAGLAETDAEAAADRLERLMRVRWKNLEGDAQARLKLIKYGLSRGYEYPEVESAVRKITSKVTGT